MHAEAERAGDSICLVHLGDGLHLAIVCVLEAQELRPCVVGIVGLHHGTHMVEVEKAIGPYPHRLGLDAAQNRRSPSLVSVGVGVLAGDVLVAATAMAQQRAQVALGAARYEQAGFFAQQLRRLGFERDDRGIVTPHVVADRRRHHRRQHSWRRSGHGVRAQVDHGGHLGHGTAGLP